MTETRSGEILRAVRRGLDTADDALPRFPKAPRWDRDPDLDDRVARLKVLRDATAARLDLDPGVLCSRERLEAVARRMPRTAPELAAMPELRQWQAAELGPEFLKALWPPETPAAVEPASDSPYRDE
jgi:ribonuclease D